MKPRGWFQSLWREAKAPMRGLAPMETASPAVSNRTGNHPDADHENFQKEGREPREVPLGPVHRLKPATGAPDPLGVENKPSAPAAMHDSETGRSGKSVVIARRKESDLETGRKETKPKTETEKPRVTMFSRSFAVANQSPAVLPTYAIEASEKSAATEKFEFQRGTEEKRVGRKTDPGTPSTIHLPARRTAGVARPLFPSVREPAAMAAATAADSAREEPDGNRAKGSIPRAGKIPGKDPHRAFPKAAGESTPVTGALPMAFPSPAALEREPADQGEPAVSPSAPPPPRNTEDGAFLRALAYRWDPGTGEVRNPEARSSRAEEASRAEETSRDPSSSETRISIGQVEVFVTTPSTRPGPGQAANSNASSAMSRHYLRRA